MRGGKEHGLELVIDRLREKYGYAILRRALVLLSPALGDAKGTHVVHSSGFLGTLQQGQWSVHKNERRVGPGSPTRRGKHIGRGIVENDCLLKDNFPFSHVPCLESGSGPIPEMLCGALLKKAAGEHRREIELKGPPFWRLSSLI